MLIGLSANSFKSNYYEHCGPDIFFAQQKVKKQEKGGFFQNLLKFQEEKVIFFLTAKKMHLLHEGTGACIALQIRKTRFLASN